MCLLVKGFDSLLTNISCKIRKKYKQNKDSIVIKLLLVYSNILLVTKGYVF